MYHRFMSVRKDMPHECLQEFVIVDYSRALSIMAVIQQDKKNIAAGLGQYWINEESHTAEVAFAVRDEYQNSGIGSELLSYITYLARRQGLLGFDADVLIENRRMLHLLEKQGFITEKHAAEGVYRLKMSFSE